MEVRELCRQVVLGNEWPCSGPAWGRTTSQAGRPEADGQSAAAKEGFSPLHKAARLTQMPNYKRKCELPSSLALFYGRAGFNVSDVCRPGLCWREEAAGATPPSLSHLTRPLAVRGLACDWFWSQRDTRR